MRMNGEISIHVQFFSRLRELAGVSEMEIDVPKEARAADLLQILFSRTPALRSWDKSILIAAGLEFVERDYVLRPGDQISIMPPLQGG